MAAEEGRYAAMRPVKLDQDDNEGGEQNYNNFMIDYRGAMQKREVRERLALFVP
mgnify:CR=1 FL=1